MKLSLFRVDIRSVTFFRGGASFTMQKDVEFKTATLFIFAPFSRLRLGFFMVELVSINGVSAFQITIFVIGVVPGRVCLQEC